MDIKPETIAPVSARDVDKAVDMLLCEENVHFDNLTEKAKLYKEVFIEVVFNGVKLVPGDDVQSQLLPHGLITSRGKDLFVSNPIYKKRFTETFFREVSETVDPSSGRYYLPGGDLR